MYPATQDKGIHWVPRFVVRNELNDTGRIAMRKEWFPVLERGT
jgi:hypothetical protein